MPTSEGSRQFALKYLFDKCGFQFNESDDLSPDTRQRIGDLATRIQELWAIDSTIEAQKAQRLRGTSGAKVPAGIGVLLAALSIVGLALGFEGPLGGVFALGVFLTVIGGVVSWRHRSVISAKINATQQVRNGEWLRWTAQANALSVSILEESRIAYQQKVRPRVFEVKVDFAALIQAAQGKGVILDKVACPSCGATLTLPRSGDTVRCSYCGSQVTATNLFEKIKPLLS